MNSKECRLIVIELENALKILFPKEQIEVTFNDSLFIEDFRFTVKINDYTPKHLFTGLLLNDLSSTEKYKGIYPIEESVVYFAYEYLMFIKNPDTDNKPPFPDDIRDCYRAKIPLQHKRYLEVKELMDRHKTFKTL